MQGMIEYIYIYSYIIINISGIGYMNRIVLEYRQQEVLERTNLPIFRTLF
jgi:hypothetical protein